MSPTKKAHLRFLSLCAFLSTGAAACENSDVNVIERPDASAHDDSAPTTATTCKEDVSAETGPTLADLDTVEMSWMLNFDAGQLLQDSVTVTSDGIVWCYQSLNGTTGVSGHLDEPDTELMSLLSQPGMIARLVTPCLRRWADAGPYITTSLAAGNTVVTRLVFEGCEDEALLSLVAALRRAGETCVQQAAAAASN
jgi:hypothetical protein